MKVLLNGPNFHNYNLMIAKALNEFADSVEISNWPDIYKGNLYKWKTFAYTKVYKNMDEDFLLSKFLYDKLKDYNRQILEHVKRINPDLILTLRGDILFPETVKYIKNNTHAHHIIWCYDSPFRYSNVLKSADYYDLFYTFEPSDVDRLKKYKIEAKFLPMAYDPECYFKLNNTIKNIDISFIGNLYLSRKDLLEKLCMKYQNINLQIWYKSWTWYNPILQYEYKIKRKELSKHINNYNIGYHKANEIYNHSKICLNSHHSQSVTGLNPRTFEILGSGGFELIDYKPILPDLFEIGKEIECYNNEKELAEKIEYYIDNDKEREKIAKCGLARVKKEHTYSHRIQQILEDLEYAR